MEYSEYISNFTIKQQNLYSQKEITENFLCEAKSILSFNESDIYAKWNIQEITPIKIFIHSEILCFTLFLQLNGESDDRYLVNSDSVEREKFDPIIGISYSSSYSLSTIYLHSKKESVVENKNWFSISLSNSNEKWTSIRYQKNNC